jgi:hypothetical protein
MDNQSNMDSPLLKPVNNEQNKAVQLLNHILNYRDETDIIYFIVSNHFAVVEIKYNQ